MWTKRFFAILCGLSMLASAGCCPEGTVPCKVTVIKWENGNLVITRRTTCVPPGTCPMDEPGSPNLEALLASFGIKLLEGLEALDPRDVKFKLNSRGPANSHIRLAAAKARAYRLDEYGRVADQASFSTVLDIVDDTGTSWVLSPQGGPAFEQFLRDTAKILVEGARGNTFFEYVLELSFDKPPRQVAQDGLDVTLVVFGVEL